MLNRVWEIMERRSWPVHTAQCRCVRVQRRRCCSYKAHTRPIRCVLTTGSTPPRMPRTGFRSYSRCSWYTGRLRLRRAERVPNLKSCCRYSWWHVRGTGKDDTGSCAFHWRRGTAWHCTAARSAHTTYDRQTATISILATTYPINSYYDNSYPRINRELSTIISHQATYLQTIPRPSSWIMHARVAPQWLVGLRMRLY